jgi:putative glutamine amidotransferase
MSVQRPLIGIPADRRPLGPQAYHLVAEKYLAAVLDAAGALPVIVPAIGRELALDDLLESLHGLLFMGSPSNVDPRHYRGEPSICRGFQEMNVAFGGTLWQKLQEVPGHIDHREPSDQPIDKQYGLAHAVRLEPGGVLQKLAGGATEIRVNSLHGQGVRELGAGLAVEARAPDGVIEAFRVLQAKTFALAVQWHPEWRVLENDFSRALFAEFGSACRERMNSFR